MPISKDFIEQKIINLEGLIKVALTLEGTELEFIHCVSMQILYQNDKKISRSLYELIFPSGWFFTGISSVSRPELSPNKIYLQGKIRECNNDIAKIQIHKDRAHEYFKNLQLAFLLLGKEFGIEPSGNFEYKFF